MKKIDFKNWNRKQQMTMHRILRGGIQLFFFLLLPAAFTTAFAGVKYIFTQLGVGEKIELNSFVIVLLALCGYTILFGRFFCGFACAFGALGDAVHALYLYICKKCRKKVKKLSVSLGKKLDVIKYLVLCAISLLCFGGIYAVAQGCSPWDVFSMIQAGNFHLKGYGIGIVLLFLILIGMCVQERFFCRFLCPMGAVFSLLPMLPVFSLFRYREQCLKGCSGCTRNCPADLELPEGGERDVTGECFQCQKCINTCPKSNVHTGIRKLKGNEIWFTLLKAVLLYLVLRFAGL